MWGESSKNCEMNCQCSGLITENFRINSGNNATKRKQEEALTYNYKVKIKPHSIDFTQNSPNTPNKVLGEIQKALTPQRKVFGELQNSPNYSRVTDKSPSFNRSLKSFNCINSQNSPSLNGISKIPNSPILTRLPNSPGLARIPNSPGFSRIPNSPGFSRIPNSPGFSKIPNSPGISRIKNSPTTPLTGTKYSPKLTPLYIKNSPAMERLKSPLQSARERKRSKISRIFEDRTKFRANKENESFNIEEETQDCMFGNEKRDWTMSKLDFSDIEKAREMDADIYVPEDSTTLEPDLETLQDLEEEFEANNFDECTKYEIVSTDSPNIRRIKVNKKNFDFGAPLSENETSTSFNRPSSSRVLNFEKRIERSKSNRSLNFDESRPQFDDSKMDFDDSESKFSEQFEESFEFTSPMKKAKSKFEDFTPKKTLSVKKSLKFTESPKFDKHSSIGSMSQSPCSTISKRFTSESMESGFMSELEEPFLEMDEISNSPKISNFNDLLSGQIKESFTEKLRPVHRSLSFNPTTKRMREEEGGSSKRRKSETSPEVQRPVLHRAFSENNASIMSALARSAIEPDLIGDFSSPFALPLMAGDHSDLKSISCDTLAGLIRGDYSGSIQDFQVIDCRYPYEFAGGHIRGARNLFTAEQILELVNTPREGGGGGERRVLIFHCEFSLERGPKLSRFLRSSDRAKNQENYPNLHYPEVYLLHAGYRSFYKNYPDLCSPAGYTAMLDPQHRHLLRKHRSLQPSGRRNRLLL